MKTLARIPGLITFVLGAAIYLEVRSMAGALFLWVPKLVGAAAAPFLAVAGTLAAALGVVCRDGKAMALGAIGAALAWRYTGRVAEPHDGFAQVFGPDWATSIPPERRARFLDRRWHWQLPSVPEPRWDRDVPFWTVGEDRLLLCDLWQPPAGVEPSGLAYIYLHGSGWHFLDKDAGTRPIFRHLAAQGHVIMDVAYRLCPEVRFREMIGDVKRAIAWMKAHAGEYGVKPDRIALGGGSAGGHLALLAAYAPNHPDLEPADVAADTSICGVISSYGPPDLRAAYACFVTTFFSPERRESALDRVAERGLKIMGEGEVQGLDWMLRGLLGGSPEECPGAYALASPMAHVGPHCPPTLLLQGAHDLAIRAETVRRLHSALRDAGVPALYVEYPFTDHGFDLALLGFLGPAGQMALHDVERFLALLAG